jgi:hypothetical protein
LKIYFATESIKQEADSLSIKGAVNRLISYFYWRKETINIKKYIETGKL